MIAATPDGITYWLYFALGMAAIIAILWRPVFLGLARILGARRHPLPPLRPLPPPHDDEVQP